MLINTSNSNSRSPKTYSRAKVDKLDRITKLSKMLATPNN